MTPTLSTVLEQLDKSNDIYMEVKFICRVKNKRSMKTNSRQGVMLLTLTDGDHKIGGAIFPDDYSKYKNAVSVGDLAEVHGQLGSFEGEEPRITITYLRKAGNRPVVMKEKAASHNSLGVI